MQQVTSGAEGLHGLFRSERPYLPSTVTGHGSGIAHVMVFIPEISYRKKLFIDVTGKVHTGHWR